MINKIFILLVAALLLCFTTTYSQVTSSPYTLFGTGQIMDNGFGAPKAMGGTGRAFYSRNSINNLNPASYCGLDSLTFLFELGIYGKYTNYRSASATENAFDGNIRYMAIGFRNTSWWASSLGIVPYSSVGYNITTTEYIEGDLSAIKKNFTGSGGINQFYYGNSFSPNKHISIGINSSYIFGSVEQSESVAEVEGYEGYSLKKANFIKSLALDYGILLNTDIGKLNYSIGLTYGNQKTLKTSTDLKFGTSYDTIELRTTSNDFILPERFGAGIGISKGNNFRLGLDYSKENWSLMKFSNLSLQTRDGEKYSFGLEYFPQKSKRDYGLKTLYYRFGGFYQKSYMVVNKIPIDTRAITFGVGLPISRKSSIINLSTELGQTGSLKKGLIKESYVLFHINFSLRDIWFQKPRYD